MSGRAFWRCARRLRHQARAALPSSPRRWCSRSSSCWCSLVVSAAARVRRRGLRRDHAARPGRAERRVRCIAERHAAAGVSSASPGPGDRRPAARADAVWAVAVEKVVFAGLRGLLASLLMVPIGLFMIDVDWPPSGSYSGTADGH
ncbi:hypothetical protein HBB16_12020 [Pseudonocardia sp. MCCB 268]|nr:hypothetical protein [Pseudonocardia cytotoxica]